MSVGVGVQNVWGVVGSGLRNTMRNPRDIRVDMDAVDISAGAPVPVVQAGEEAKAVTTLEWNIESYSVGTGKGAKQILRKVAGKTSSGELTGLLGPSGSGKTSLLQCLSLRTRGFEGTLRMDGRCPSGHYFTATALVHQTQLFFGFMTPREHLTFQAIARMARTHSRRDIYARVEQVLRDTQLQKCADTVIGGTDLLFMKRGVSGGERKRVAIATELLHSPKILMLDEPTSGLDSVMAEIVIAILSRLAERGNIVLTCVHSPSSELMTYFTHLLLLTHDGRLAYHGPRAGVVNHFTRLSYKFPPEFNTADYLLQILSCPYLEEEDEQVDWVEENERLGVITRAYQSSDMSLKNPLAAEDEHKSLQRIMGHGASDWTLFKINAWRYYILFRRDTQSLVLWAVSNGLVGALFGLLFFNQASSNWRNLMGLLFTLSVVVLLVGVLGNLVRFPLEWAPFTREYYAGTNAVGPYFLARYVYAAPFVWGPVCMALTVYWMTGMAPDLVTFLEFTGILSLSLLASMSLGQLASCLSHNIFVGLALAPTFIAPMIMFAGLLYQRNTVPVWLAWIEKISIVNYTFASLLIQQVPILRDGVQHDLLFAFLEIHPSQYLHDIMMLLVLFFSLSTITYVVLTLRMRFSTDVV